MAGRQGRRNSSARSFNLSPPIERVRCVLLLGRVLRPKTSVSPRRPPANDNSAMDGYAVSFFADLKGRRRDDASGASANRSRAAGGLARSCAGECRAHLHWRRHAAGADSVVHDMRPPESDGRVQDRRGRAVNRPGHNPPLRRRRPQVGSVVFRAGQRMQPGRNWGGSRRWASGEVSVLSPVLASGLLSATGDELKWSAARWLPARVSDDQQSATRL